MATTSGEVLGSKAGSGVGNDFGIGVGTGTFANEINMTIEKTTVEARTRKLRSRWSIEVAQDLKAMHGIDIEKEMMDILAYEITAEIDREIVNAIYGKCNSTYSSTITWGLSSDMDGRWEAERYRNIYNKLVRKANQIGILTRRGVGNKVIASSNVSAIFEASADFTICPVDAKINTAQMGVSKVGSLGGRFDLYRDTFINTDQFVVLYKGPNNFDAGIIYLPYVQLQMAKAQFEGSFNPAIGISTRYGLMDNMFGSTNFHIKCTISGLPS
jgi:hypothetical protein